MVSVEPSQDLNLLLYVFRYIVILDHVFYQSFLIINELHFSYLEDKCVQLHSEVIQKVLETKDEHCRAVKMSESFIYPIDVKYPFTMNAEDIKCYSLTEIARAKVKGQEKCS